MIINSPEKCLCCFGKPIKRDSHILINGKPKKLTVRLEKHHIQYFPEVIAHVHDFCHVKIHEGKYPHLIQYNKGDSKKFWGENKTSEVWVHKR